MANAKYLLTRWIIIFDDLGVKHPLFMILCVMWFASVHCATGIILVGGGNLFNVTDPGNGAPWDEVARVTNGSGTHTTSGTAIHLGGGYMLTANHVSLSQGYVSFDGITTYQIAGGSALQVTSGSDVIDLKVFQLTDNPGTSGVNLLPEVAKGVELFPAYREATHIGWGVGQNPSDPSNPWSWGDASTSDKRWGVNDFEDAITIPPYTFGGMDYIYESLVTSLDSDATANEAAATIYDSGSGLFIKDDADHWFLAGTMVTVSTNGSSTFADDGSQDLNFSVRIAEYANEIAALMTSPIAVPEPAMYGLLLGCAALGFTLRRRNAARARTRGCRRCL